MLLDFFANIKKVDVNEIIIAILSFDTLRSVIAMMGVVKRETPILGRLIYGKYDVIIVEEALRELGYSEKESEKISNRLKRASKRQGCPEEDLPLKLLFILSRYIVKFDKDISYGMVSKGKTLSYSKYYINTMEAVHDPGMLKDLSGIMISLIRHKGKEEFDFIIVPKGGNPLLAQYVAGELGIALIIAKDINDSARPQENTEKERLAGIKYEGLQVLLNKNPSKNMKGIVIDCNTSGGTQLITIVKDFNDLLNRGKYQISPIEDCYVLFKLVKRDNYNGKEVSIDKKFSDVNCKLHRFFDLDEEDKSDLDNISYTDYYEAYGSEKLNILKDKIKKKNRYYF